MPGIARSCSCGVAGRARFPVGTHGEVLNLLTCVDLRPCGRDPISCLWSDWLAVASYCVKDELHVASEISSLALPELNIRAAQAPEDNESGCLFQWTTSNCSVPFFNLWKRHMPFDVLCDNLVDPASSHMLVLRIKPCMRQYESIYR